jgi:hypothetical protein
MTVTRGIETVTARNEHDEGWSGSLDRLAEYLAET